MHCATQSRNISSASNKKDFCVEKKIFLRRKKKIFASKKNIFASKKQKKKKIFYHWTCMDKSAAAAAVFFHVKTRKITTECSSLNRKHSGKTKFRLFLHVWFIPHCQNPLLSPVKMSSPFLWTLVCRGGDPQGESDDTKPLITCDWMLSNLQLPSVWCVMDGRTRSAVVDCFVTPTGDDEQWSFVLSFGSVL